MLAPTRQVEQEEGSTRSSNWRILGPKYTDIEIYELRWRLQIDALVRRQRQELDELVVQGHLAEEVDRLLVAAAGVGLAADGLLDLLQLVGFEAADEVLRDGRALGERGAVVDP